MFPHAVVDDSLVQLQLHAGPYTGEAYADGYNLEDLANFSEYESLLADGTYLDSALDETPVLDQIVYVYTLSDFTSTSDPNASNPTIWFRPEYSAGTTAVLSSGMNGKSWSETSGTGSKRVSGVTMGREAVYVIVLGEDIQGYEIQGYRDAGCDEGEELNDLSCSVTRSVSTLGAEVRRCVEQYGGSPNQDLLYELTAELLTTIGPLGNEAAKRYDSGELEFMVREAEYHSRVFYGEFELTIQAGESVTVRTTQIRYPSCDSHGTEPMRYGYDIASTLESNLNFTKQTASISNDSGIEILNQNFGFDPDHDITVVQLDLTEKRYWLDIAGTD